LHIVFFVFDQAFVDEPHAGDDLVVRVGAGQQLVLFLEVGVLAALFGAVVIITDFLLNEEDAGIVLKDLVGT
jgi:hypothetical protein